MMSHPGRNGRGSGPTQEAHRVAGLLLGAALWLHGPSLAQAQVEPAVAQPAAVGSTSAPAPATSASAAAPAASASEPAPGVVATMPVAAADRVQITPGVEILGGVAGATVIDSTPLKPGAVLIEPDVQIVRFQGPPGLVVEVLGPAPVPVPVGDGGGIITVGLKRGVGYRLHITGIVERPLAELFPVIEVVGHLHRPDAIEPGKYPIRVVFNQDDLDDAVDRARLVTKIVYLEDPDQAIPLRMAKDQVSVVTLSPAEPPLRVASGPGPPDGDRAHRWTAADTRGNSRGSRGRYRARLGRAHRRATLPVPVSKRCSLRFAVRTRLLGRAPSGASIVAA